MNLTDIKRILLFTCLLIICRQGWGQTLSQLTKNERLEVLSSKDDTSKIRSLNKLGNRHVVLFVQFKIPAYRDSTFLIYAKAKTIADGLKTTDKTYWQMLVLSGIGESECYTGDTVSGKKKLLKAIDFFAQHHYLNEEYNNLRILCKSAEYYGNAQGQMVYLRVLVKLALKNKNINVLIRTKERIIDVFGRSDNPDTIKELYIKLINEYKHTNVPELDYAYGQLAVYHRYRANLSQALFYALAAHDWMIKTNDTIDNKKSMFYGELAEIYQALGQPVKSIEWYKKTIDVRRKLNINQVSVYRTTGFLVQEYIKLKQPYVALEYINKLAAEYPPIGANNQANLWQMKAYCYDALGQYAQAEQAYLKMIDGYRAFKNDEEIWHLANYDIGKFYVDRKQYKKASLYVNPQSVDNWPPVEVKNYHYLLFKIDSANQNYLSAIKHFNVYKNLSDSIFNDTKSKQISELEIKYATDQKEKDIVALKKDRRLQDENIKQARSLRDWTFAGIGLLLLVLGLLYNSFKINQRKTKEIDLKNASLNNLLAEKDNLLEEKEWLMKEIHHRVKNNLQIVMGLLQRQSSFVDNKVALTAIQNSEHRMHSIALIHQKLYQSDDYELVNMPGYITDMIGYLKDCFDLAERIRFEKQIADIDFGINTVVPLGLILNEAITNAIKYAFPADEYGIIVISLQQNGNGGFLLEINDNGCGLPDDMDASKIHSMGFNLMRGLSKQLGGTFNATNKDGLNIAINFRAD